MTRIRKNTLVVFNLSIGKEGFPEFDYWTDQNLVFLRVKENITTQFESSSHDVSPVNSSMHYKNLHVKHFVTLLCLDF